MNDTNVVIISGRLTKDIEFINRDDFQISKFSVAINYSYKKNDEWQTETTFVDVSAWNKLAEIANRILHKGCSVNIEARLVQEHWQTADGANRSRLVLRADKINKVKDSPKHQAESTKATPF